MTNMEKHFSLLGMRVEDRVTGLTGVVTSLSFDLYGCIQALLHPGIDSELKIRDLQWLDVVRLKVISNNPVIDRPEYEWTPKDISTGCKGSAEKPLFNKF